MLLKMSRACIALLQCECVRLILLAHSLLSHCFVLVRPTFIFLKGDRELERVKGANRTYVICVSYASPVAS